MLKFYFLAVTYGIALLNIGTCLRKLVFNGDFIIIICDCKGIDNKMVLQHLDFRENGILPNPDGRSYRVTRTAGIWFRKRHY
jgi:hypothetical protein